MNQEGMINYYFEAELIATELLLDCPNVRLYNFHDKYDIITNLDNYRDKEHYGAHINSMILKLDSLPADSLHASPRCVINRATNPYRIHFRIIAFRSAVIGCAPARDAWPSAALVLQ